MFDIIEKNYYKIVSSYIMFVFFYCLARLIVPLQFISANQIVTVVMTGCGILVGAYNVIIKKIYIHTKYIEWLILFFIFNFITLLSVIKSGYSNNIKHGAVFFIYFFVLYSTYSVLNKEQMKKIFNNSFLLMTIFQTVGVIISIAQFLMLKGYTIVDYRGITLRQGFVGSRLFGILASPNYMSLLSLIVLIFVLYNIKNTKGTLKRLAYAVIFLNFAYVVLSGSRTTFICLLAVSIIYAVYIATNYKKLRNKLFSMLAVLLVVLCGYYGIKQSANIYLKVVSNTVVKNNNEVAVKKEELTLERVDTDESNISNNRFAIWQGTLSVVPHKPILGVSSGYWLEEARSYDPENYIVKEEYLPHNGYIELLFYNGILGIFAMGMFILKSFLNILKKLSIKNLSADSNSQEKLLILSVFITIMISNLFLSATLYGMMILGAILFTVLGYFNSSYAIDSAGYKKLSLEEVKKVELEILKYVHGISEKHNINYQLGYGTLLGAVRHKGFIPWDDDIDITLLRADYERLYEVLQKESNDRYKVVSYKNNTNYYLPFFRVQDTNTIYENNYSSSDNLRLGVCIDVFPLDYAQDINKEICKLDNYRKLSAYSFHGIRNKNIQEIYNVPRYILSFIFRLIRPTHWIRKMDALASTTKENSRVDYLLENKKYDTTLNIKWLEETTYLEFENYKFKVPKHYKEVLTKIYGEDFMVLPPIEQRQGHDKFSAYIKE